MLSLNPDRGCGADGWREVKELHCGRWKRKVPIIAEVKHYVLFKERFGDE